MLHRVAKLCEMSHMQLKGKYSVERMHVLKLYSARTSYWRAAAIIAFTVVPCLALCVQIDAIPLAAPSEG